MLRGILQLVHLSWTVTISTALRTAAGVLWVVSGLAGEASASLLLPPAVGVPDTAMEGANVAKAATPEGALFQNPAGLIDFERTTTSIGLGLIFSQQEVDAAAPIDYDHTDNGLVMVPSGGISTPLGPGWRFGIGMPGTTGASLDFPPEDDVNTGLFTESAVAALPLALAYELRSDFWVGAGIVPLFGYLRNRFTLIDPGTGGALPVKYSLRGPGVQGVLGATWLPNEMWSLGLGLRTPGAVWMDGSTPFAGERRDVDLCVHMPTQIFAGVTRQVTQQLEVSSALRWTDSSTFGESKIKFSTVSLPYVSDAHDEWRVSLGSAYALSEQLELQLGAAYASRIVGNEGISPILFDSEDVKVSAGMSWRLGSFELHSMLGYALPDDREVSAQDALILPGEYEVGGVIVMLGLTHQR